MDENQRAAREYGEAIAHFREYVGGRAASSDVTDDERRAYRWMLDLTYGVPIRNCGLCRRA
jgi:hypothetical protein